MISSTSVRTPAVRSSDAPGRELHVDAEYALVLLGDEPGGERAREQAGPHRHHHDEDES